MRKTRIVSLILAAVMVLTMAPLAIPVFADVSVATPGENAYLDIHFQRGDNNTDVVNKCLKIYNRAHSFWSGVALETTYQLDAGVEYTIKFDAKADVEHYFRLAVGAKPVSGGGKVLTGGNSNGDKYDSGTPVLYMPGWHTFTYTYTPAANESFSLALYGGDKSPSTPAADVYLDNVLLYKDGIAEPVQTYDFNSGAATNWTDFNIWNKGMTSEFEVVDSDIPTGKVDTDFDYYFALTGRTGFWGGAIFDPDLAVTAGEKYTINFDVKGANPAAGLRAYPSGGKNPQQKLTYNGFGDTNYIGVRFDDGTPLSGDRDGWYTHTITYEALTDHNFVLRLPGCPAGGKDVATDSCDFYIDNVILYKEGVAEPILSTTFTPGTSNNGFAAWVNNDGKVPCEGTVITPPPAVDAAIGAGAAFNTGLVVEADKTYNIEFALQSNLADATYFAKVYTNTTLELEAPGMAVTAGTADPDAEGWYKHTIKYKATESGTLNFDILGGEAFAHINNIAAGAHIFLDSIAVYVDGVADALYTANISSYDDMPGFIELTSADGKYTTKVAFDPSRFIAVETDDAGATGILAMLLLRRKALAMAGTDTEEPVVPEEPAVEANGYISITERPTFWSGAVFESFETVYPDKKYTITFEAKTEDTTNDFRMSPVQSSVTTDGNLGTSSGVLFTSGTPVEGKDGWYAFSFPYIPTEEHTFAVRIFGGYQAKGVDLAVGVSNADFHLDNFCLYEDGVEEPILEYDFDTDKYIEDWNSFVIYTPDAPNPVFTHVLPVND